MAAHKGIASRYTGFLILYLKGYSGVNLIHVLTHLDTEYDPPSRDKVCGQLAYVVLASSETTAQQKYAAVNGSKYKSPSKSHK